MCGRTDDPTQVDRHFECEPICTCDCTIGLLWCGCSCCKERINKAEDERIESILERSQLDLGLITYAEAFGKAFQKVMGNG